MSENPAAWFVQNKAAQAVILLDETTLFPKRITGWWCHTANDDVTDFSFGMTADYMDDSACSHNAGSHRFALKSR